MVMRVGTFGKCCCCTAPPQSEKSMRFCSGTGQDTVNVCVHAQRNRTSRYTMVHLPFTTHFNFVAGFFPTHLIAVTLCNTTTMLSENIPCVMTVENEQYQIFLEDNLDIFLESDKHYHILKMLDRILLHKKTPETAFEECLTSKGKQLIAGKLLRFYL
jgi:hypothetical protein